MSGAEYLDFVRDPKNKERYFMDLHDVVLECSKEDYLENRAEKRHHDYLETHKKNWTIISLYAQEEKESNGEELIVDPSVNVEELTIRCVLIRAVQIALRELPADDAALLSALYLQESPVSLRTYSRQTGIPLMTLYHRKEKLLEQLKKLLGET